MNLIDWITQRTWKSERQWFWVKETWHFFGGATIGMIGNLFGSSWVALGLMVLLMSVIIVKEILEDRVTQTRKKTIADVCAWFLGFAVVTWARFL